MRRIVSVGVTLLFLGSVRVGATLVVPAELGELARDAAAIVRGRVIAADSRWTDSRRGIETIVSLEVDGSLKGETSSILYFRVPGGQLGRYRSIVVGAPEFRVGERVIVFLGGHAPAVPHVLGLYQGVFRVVPTDAGWVVTPPTLNTTIMGASRVVRGDPQRKPVPLVDFERGVRALTGEGQ